MTPGDMSNKNRCLLCASVCNRCKAIPEADLNEWIKLGWTRLGKLDQVYMLIAYQPGCEEFMPIAMSRENG